MPLYARGEGADRPVPAKPADQPEARRPRSRAVDRRELILVAAAKRFAEHGFEATTVRDLAEDVNVLSGSLYHHFATKEDILHAIVREPAVAQRDMSVRVASADVGAEVRLVSLIEADLRLQAGRQEAFAIIFSERKFFRRSVAFGYVTRARKETFDAWVHILADGAAAGEFRDGIDPYLTVSTIMRLLTMGADWYRNEDGSPVDSQADYSLEALSAFYAGFVLRSIRAPGRGSESLPSPLLDI